MAEKIDVPYWVFLAVGAVVLVAVLAVMFWPKEQPAVVDRSCPDLAFLMERVNLTDNKVVLMSKDANLTYPQNGTLAVKSKKGVSAAAKLDTVTCRRGGAKLNENINYYYCEGLLISGPLTDEKGIVTQIVNRGATMIYSSLDGKYVGRVCEAPT